MLQGVQNILSENEVKKEHITGEAKHVINNSFTTKLFDCIPLHRLKITIQGHRVTGVSSCLG